MNFPTKRILSFSSVLAVAFLCGVAGCSKSGKVTGTVKLNGKKVPVGTITFIPEKGTSAVGEIEDGTYTVEKVPAGSVTVTIDTSRQRAELTQLLKGGGPGAIQVPGSKAPKKSEIKGGGPEEMQSAMREAEEKQKERLAKLKDMVDVPPEFADPKKSGLSYTITSGSQEIDIDLKPKK